MSALDEAYIAMLERSAEKPQFQLEAIRYRISVVRDKFKLTRPGVKRTEYLMELQELMNLFSHIYRGNSVNSFYVYEDEF